MARNNGQYPDPNGSNAGGPYPAHDNHSNDAEHDNLNTQLRRAMGQPTEDSHGTMPGASAAPVMSAGYDAQYAPQYFANGAQQMVNAQMAPPANMGGAGTTAMATTPVAATGSRRSSGAGKAKQSSGRAAKKASRACDECRRKKVKCDKQSASEPCSNCKKNDPGLCIFSREPQKRGPNKGYIKALSDRLADVEQTIHGGGAANAGSPNTGFPPPPPVAAAPTPAPATGSKRKADYAGLVQAQYSGRLPPATPVGMSNLTGSTLPSAQVAAGPTNTAPLNETENALLEQYFEHIHPTVPILSEDRSKLHVLVTACSANLRTAFFRTIAASVTPTDERLTTYCAALNQLHRAADSNPAQREHTTNVVYLHSLVFAIMAADSLGNPATLSPGAPSVGMLYGEARDVAAHLKLDSVTSIVPGNEELSAEIFAAGRRAFWTLLTLDAFKALGEGTVPTLTTPGPLVDGDLESLGHTLYELARCASFAHEILDDMDEARQTRRLMTKPKRLGIVYTMMKQTTFTAHPVVAAAQAHLALLMYRLIAIYELGADPASSPASATASGAGQTEMPPLVIGCLAQNIQTYLDSAMDIGGSPLFAHFVALAVFVTDELIRTTDGPNNPKAEPVLASLQTLVATSEGSSTASGWMPGLDAAVNEMYGRLAEKKKADLTGWALNIVNGYMGIFA